MSCTESSPIPGVCAKGLKMGIETRKCESVRWQHESQFPEEDAQGLTMEHAMLRDLEESLEKEAGEEEDGKPSVLKDKPASAWKSTFWPEDSDIFHDVTQRNQKLIPFLSPQTGPEARPHTVVLHGAAGVGKTTQAKRTLLDWSEFSQSPLHCAFYLSCRELNHMIPCTFAELISKDCPEMQDIALEVLTQVENVLFVVDGFEELKVPAGVLIHDICSDWNQKKPVPVLLSSLLKRKMVAKATLLVTTRPEALQELLLLVEQPLLVEVEGFSEADRELFFLRHLEDTDQALRALDTVKHSSALFHLGTAPAVCQLLCASLKLLMDGGEDPGLACQTTTSLFLRFLCDQFTPAPGGHPQHHLRRPLKALCLLAAQGLWTRVSLFDTEDLEPLEVEEADLRPFLDKHVLQRDRDHEDCFSFIHLSMQQFLAAAFYILRFPGDSEWQGSRLDIGGVRELFSTEARARNPQLAQAGRFLWGLLNGARARELEATFGCQASLEAGQELLKRTSEEEEPVLWAVGLLEVFHCLYESQDPELVSKATATLKDASLHLTTSQDLLSCSFCLQHCQDLQRLSLRVAKGVLPEEKMAALEPCLRGVRSRPDSDTLCLWMDLCSVVSNKNLRSLDISRSFLSEPAVRLLCDCMTHISCRLQTVTARSVFPETAYQDLCLALVGKRTLTHLTLGGSLPEAQMLLLLLGETLKHNRCRLQCLRLGLCSAPTQDWSYLFLTLQVPYSLTCLDLSDSELLDEGAKLLCAGLRHPTCPVQRLSLENCQLTEACCKEVSVTLVVSQRLTHLCLAKNDLRDDGVKTLCEGLRYPYCQLQALVLRDCNLGKHGCRQLSTLLREKCSLTHLDLGLNPIAAGLWFLCDALRNPNFHLKYLGLWGCSLTPLHCQKLASALVSNQTLETLDLGQNALGLSGVTVLLEALRDSSGPLRTLRLKMDAWNAKVQEVLREVKESNPGLTLDSAVGTKAPSCCQFFFSTP
ncbi:NACHT, LRR and PYD domains-containing protein 7-like [Callospermophilus lateralis]|uniref:NACHT, LRR and PYD domains-containing protein 7-like n=1 Tax=Callospermophilus lateralis TaxID=76772 RepID=UPI004054825F